MIMFWHRKKLLEIDEQLKTLMDRLDEISTENASLKEAFVQLQNRVSGLELGQGQILEALTSITSGQQSSQETIRSMMDQQKEAAASSENTLRTLRDNVAEVGKSLFSQSSTIQTIDTATKQIVSDMSTLDEAMRLLLVNSLLDNFPQK
ncbi:MAG: hypothetical protein KH138_12460 [Firmicutes bacterium]|nr:hypothetical protein [Bacillota bacterium]